MILQQTRRTLLLRSVYRLCALAFPLFCICPSLSAQGRFGQWVHTSWSDQQGAPSSIRGLAKASDGYLWIASADGLFRFDGTTFEKIHFAGPHGEPVSSVVNGLFTASDGDIWAATSEAVGIIHNGQLHLQASTGKASPMHVWCFAQDKQGHIWAAAANGVYRWSAGIWEPMAQEYGLPSKSFRSVFVDQAGEVLVSAGTELYLRKTEASTFERLPVTIRNVNHLQQDVTGRLWVADTAFAVHPLVLTGSRDPMRDSRVEIGSFRLAFDVDGKLWITSVGDGIRRIEDPQKPFGRVVKSGPGISAFTAEGGLTDNTVQTILRDDDGAMWIGTRHGLDCFRKSPITTIPNKLVNWKTALKAGTHGDLWLDENLNLTHVTFDKGQITTRRVSYESTDMNRPQPGLPFSAVPICGDMFIGVLCASGPKVDLIGYPPGLPQGDFARWPALDRDQTLWLATDGYGVFARGGNAWRKVPVQAAEPLPPVSTAHVGVSGTVWFGYGSQLLMVQSGAVRLATFASQIHVGTLQAIEDRGDHVWFGGTRGLACFCDSHITPITTADSDALTDIKDIQETKGGSLWIVTDHGVLHINASTLRRSLADPSYRAEYQALGSREGLIGHVAYKEKLASDGSLWLVSQEGIVHVSTSEIQTTYKTPVTSVLALEANGESVPLTRLISLPPHTTNLKFRFIGINLADPTHVAYRYQLKNIDHTWQENGTEHYAMYTNLTPGTYDFHVIARNSAGDWSPDGTSLRLVILPAWYQRTTVRAFGLLTFVLLCWALLRNRIRQAERAIARYFDERLDERTRMARELHDTFLQTVQGSKMVADDALDPRADQARMRHALENLSLWLGQAVTEGRAALHALRVSTTERNHLAEFLDRTARECAQRASISVALSVIGDARDLHPIVRDEVSRIAAEAIRNACGHSKASQLSIELRYARNLTLCIKDNGVGIDPELIAIGRSGHFGIPGMRERSARICAEITIVSTLNTGTDVMLRVPGELVYRRNRDTVWAKLRGLGHTRDKERKG